MLYGGVFIKKMIKILVILVLVISAVFAVYQINSVRYGLVKAVWNVMDWSGNRSADKVLLPDGVKAEQDIAYIESGTPQQVLDVYYPENASGKLPVIIFTHGGGFVAGDKKQPRQFCMTLSKEGYTVFNINYRLAPQYKNPSQIKDVLAAILWIKENSGKYFGDKNRIVLAGDSAGAYLTAFASCISTNEELASRVSLKPSLSADEIRGIMLFSGVYDLETGSKSGFPSIKSDIEMLLGTDDIKGYNNLDDFTVTKNITANYPKVFISSGAADWVHSESIELIKALDKKNVYHKDTLFDKTEKKAMHDYQFRMELDASKQCLKGVLEFLRSVTK
jgi:acetyl esterase/lipase